MTNENSYREKGRALFLAAMLVLSVVAMTASFAGAAAAVNEDTYDDGPTFTDGDIDNVWIGQEIVLDGVSDGIISIAEGPPGDGDSSPDTVVSNESEDGEVTFETDDLEEGQYYHIYEHGQDSDSGSDFFEESFEAQSENLDVEFRSDTVSNEGTATAEYESDREETQWVNISSEDIDDEDDYDQLFGDSIQQDSDGEDIVSDDGATVAVDVSDADEAENIDFNFDDDFSTGEYEFDFEVTDSLASTNATIEVTDEDDDREFVDIDQIEEGEMSNITIDVGSADEAVVTLGDLDQEGHESSVYINDIENGEVVLQHNTAIAGDDEFEDDIDDGVNGDYNYGWSVHDDDNATIAATNISGELGADPLPAATWDVEVGSAVPAEDIDEENPEDVSADDIVNEGIDNVDDLDLLTVEERSAPGDAVTQTAPAGDSVTDFDGYNESTITDTSTIAVEDADGDAIEGDGDSLFLTVDDFGANGSIEALANELDSSDFNGDQADSLGSDLFDATGISIEVTEQESGAVGSADNWNSSDGASFNDDEGDRIDNDLPIDVYTLEDYDDQLIFEIDYQELSSDAQFESGESYDVYFNVSSEYSTLADEDYSDGGEVTFEEPEIAWDEVDEIGASEEANATGTTNVAPGTEITTRANSPSDEGSFVETDSPEVDADGVFEASFDLSDEAVGSLFDLEAEEPLAGEDDELEDITLVEADDDNESDEEGIDLEVDYDDIEEGETAEIDAIVQNLEDDNTTVDINLTIDGETYDRTVELEGDTGTTQTFAFEGDQQLSVGEYDFEVTAESADDDESADGTLTVHEEGELDDDDDDDSSGDDDDSSGDDDDSSDDDDDDGDDDDGMPGFGVAVALVALLSAAMLALRRQN